MIDNRRCEYIVIFGKSKHWTSRLLNKDISHVLVIELSNNHWLKMDPSPNGMINEVSLYNDTSVSLLRNMDDIRALKVSVHRRNNNYGSFKLMCCTNIVQYVMGLNFKWCWTPFQLYKRLLRSRDSEYININVIR